MQINIETSINKHINKTQSRKLMNLLFDKGYVNVHLFYVVTK